MSDSGPLGSVQQRGVPSSQALWRTSVGFASYVVIACGLAIRLRDYGFNRSLWLDEAMLALNVVNRTFQALLWSPLDFNQSAPVGFLAAVKFVASVAGPSEFALRLVPFVAGAIVLVGLPALAARYYDRVTAFFCACAVALSTSFINYASEFKQYGVDALIALVLLWEFHRYIEVPDGYSYKRLALVGMVAVACSHPACLILAPVGVVLFTLEARARRWLTVTRLSACVAAWVGVFLTLYWINIRPVSTHQSMMSYHAGAFAPMALSLETVGWYKNAGVTFFMYAVDPSLWLVTMVLVCVGAVSVWRRQRPVAWLLTGALAVLWTVSGAKWYPVGPRFLLYLYPLLLLVMAAGAASIVRKGNRGAIALLLLVIAYPAVTDRIRAFVSPRGREETRELVYRLEQGRQSDDAVVVWQPTVPAYLFYRKAASHDDYRVLKGDLYDRLAKADVIETLGATGATSMWVLASHMEAGGFGPENLTTLRDSLASIGTIEHAWSAKDGYLWVVHIPPGASGQGQHEASPSQSNSSGEVTSPK